MAAEAAARKKIQPIRELLGKGGVSIAALNTETGASFSYGATSGMRTGSIIKLFILETLLLQHQDNGTSMTDYERRVATQMIEVSDNAAAQTLFDKVGGKYGLDRAKQRLNVHNTDVNGSEFGLTKTCAADFLDLVRDANAPGPLTKASRTYILGLQAHVVPDQRWGVSAAADKGTTTHLKNGWLDVDADSGRWLVNSVGSVTVRGAKLYLAVLTQHGPGFESGIERVQTLATIAAGVVTPR